MKIKFFYACHIYLLTSFLTLDLESLLYMHMLRNYQIKHLHMETIGENINCCNFICFTFDILILVLCFLSFVFLFITMYNRLEVKKIKVFFNCCAFSYFNLTFCGCWEGGLLRIILGRTGGEGVSCCDF